MAVGLKNLINYTSPKNVLYNQLIIKAYNQFIVNFTGEYEEIQYSM